MVASRDLENKDREEALARFLCQFLCDRHANPSVGSCWLPLRKASERSLYFPWTMVGSRLKVSYHVVAQQDHHTFSTENRIISDCHVLPCQNVVQRKQSASLRGKRYVNRVTAIETP